MSFGRTFLANPDLFPARRSGEPWGDRRLALDLPGGPYLAAGLSVAQEAAVRERFGDLCRDAGDETGVEVLVFRASPVDFLPVDTRGWDYALDLDHAPRAVRLAGLGLMARLDWAPALAGALWTPEAAGERFAAIFENLLRVLTAYRLVELGGAVLHSAGLVDLGDPGDPGDHRRAFLFLGPSGAGKTTVARGGGRGRPRGPLGRPQRRAPGPPGERLRWSPSCRSPATWEGAGRAARYPLRALLRLEKGDGGRPAPAVAGRGGRHPPRLLALRQRRPPPPRGPRRQPGARWRAPRRPASSPSRARPASGVCCAGSSHDRHRRAGQHLQALPRRALPRHRRRGGRGAPARGRGAGVQRGRGAGARPRRRPYPARRLGGGARRRVRGRAATVSSATSSASPPSWWMPGSWSWLPRETCHELRRRPRPHLARQPAVLGPRRADLPLQSRLFLLLQRPRAPGPSRCRASSTSAFFEDLARPGGAQPHALRRRAARPSRLPGARRAGARAGLRGARQVERPRPARRARPAAAGRGRPVPRRGQPPRRHGGDPRPPDAGARQLRPPARQPPRGGRPGLARQDQQHADRLERGGDRGDVRPRRRPSACRSRSTPRSRRATTATASRSRSRPPATGCCACSASRSSAPGPPPARPPAARPAARR